MGKDRLGMKKLLMVIGVIIIISLVALLIVEYSGYSREEETVDYLDSNKQEETAQEETAEEKTGEQTQETIEQIQETNKRRDNKDDKNKDDKNNTLKDIFTETYQVPRHDIFINVPVNYMPIENGFTQLFNVGRDRSIAVTAVRRTSPSSLQDAYNMALERYIVGFESYAKINSLSIENEETLEINDIELYRFEGKLDCTDDLGDYELYTVGYSFIMDEIPCMVIGTVLDRDQPQDMIDEIRTYVDYMITTLRSEK